MRRLTELTSSFEDLAGALSAIRQCQGHDLIVSWEFNLTTKYVSLCKLIAGHVGTHIIEDN